MKFFLSFLLIVLLSFLGGIYCPWWIIAVIAFLVTFLLRPTPFSGFASGFLAILLLWGVLAWTISENNNHLLAHRISLLIIKTDSPVMLVLLTALIGAIVSGFAGMTGSLVWPFKR
jgi:hypothetical protein